MLAKCIWKYGIVQQSTNPEEIAKVGAFLASPDASYITGTTVYADGELTLSS